MNRRRENTLRAQAYESQRYPAQIRTPNNALVCQ
jgi:hypothetical protein